LVFDVFVCHFKFVFFIPLAYGHPPAGRSPA
jgi:hypothetical protein